MIDFPFYYTGRVFFSGFLTYTSGFVAFLSAFFFQFFSSFLLGSAIITAVALLPYVTPGIILPSMGIPRFPVLRVVPVILLLMVYGGYEHAMAANLVLSVALLGVCLYLWCAGRSGLFRGLVFLCLSLLLYPVAGGAYLVYASLNGVSEFKEHT